MTLIAKRRRTWRLNFSTSRSLVRSSARVRRGALGLNADHAGVGHRAPLDHGCDARDEAAADGNDHGVDRREPLGEAIWGMQAEYIDNQDGTLVEGTFVEWL